MQLVDLGFNDFFEQAFRACARPGICPARVTTQARGGYGLLSEAGELTGEVSGRFRHDARTPSAFPVVGDWVAVEVLPHAQAHPAVIHAVLPRRTKFSRSAAGDRIEEQLLATNVDDVFVVASLSREPNLRALERYLSVAWQSGAQPAVVLTKADLAADVETAVAAVRRIAAEAPVYAVSSVTRSGLATLATRFVRGRTSVLLGPSGVGKSTLINLLFGDERQDVQEVRENDDKGRHTTTSRELICLPSGALVIDTPGLRELQLWQSEGGIEEAFGDIAALAVKCRFGNCKHEREPGCAVAEAIARGEFEMARLESWRKLQREQAHFDRRYDARAQAQERRRTKNINRSLRSHSKTRR